jgi:hypothetical protein
MPRMKAEKLNLQPRVTPETRREIDRIADEWRMNVQETVAALVENWNRSTDDQRVDAIRRREPQPA